MRGVYALVVGMLCLSGCAHDPAPENEVVTSDEKVSKVSEGFIKSKSDVTATNDKCLLLDNAAGTIGGGVAGVLLANPIGRGTGTVVAKVVGGVAGAFGGAYAEEHLKSHKDIKYVVELNNGTIKTVVQHAEPALFEGQKVYVVETTDGHGYVTTTLPKM